MGIVRKETGSPSQNGEWQEPLWKGKGVKGLKNLIDSISPGLQGPSAPHAVAAEAESFPVIDTTCAFLASELSDCSCAFSATTPTQFVLHAQSAVPVFQELSFSLTNCPNDDKHSESFHFLQIVYIPQSEM